MDHEKKSILTFLGDLIWPRKNLLIQLYIFFGLVTIIIGCSVNFFVPIYSKKIVDSLVTSTFQNTSNFNKLSGILAKEHLQNLPVPWELVLIFVGLKIVQGIGSLSLLNCIQVLLWVKVEQFARRQVQISFFKHIHSLSSRWHSNTKTSDILGALERGTDSISSISEHVLYSVLPTVADILIAVTYLSLNINLWFGLITFVQIIVYLLVTIIYTEWQAKCQRALNDGDDKQRNQALESLLNFETVRYFGNELYEKDKFKKTILNVQEIQWKARICISLMEIAQMLVMNIGLLMGSLIVVWMICKGDKYGLSVGDYVLFTAYLGQLYGPLHYLGTYYRELRSSFIDLECMLDIFNEEQEIWDMESFKLPNPNGRIEFKNVTFGYEFGSEILKNASFVIPEGKVVAIVGESGSGKSTILRLLLRLYDVTSGEILLDGENIRDVQLQALRRSFGLVPQDTSLFNDSLKYNIKYSKMEAGDEEMEFASKSAQVFETISDFPEGFNTKVGERGLQLSGGEKQRIAIARTFLQDPAIILLDEATSALDIQNERDIQSSFAKLCKNRTSIIVTHKLSTVTYVDNIMVLKNGIVVEQGTHIELISRNGEYTTLWKEQVNIAKIVPNNLASRTN